LRRRHVLAFFQKLPPCRVGIFAGGRYLPQKIGLDFVELGDDIAIGSSLASGPTIGPSGTPCTTTAAASALASEAQLFRLE
jgi:hypothetical protein